MLRLSAHVTFHARGEVVFAWHGLSGEVAEMSRDVLALMLAFRVPADPRSVARRRPGGLDRAKCEEFAAILRARGLLVREGADERATLLGRYPCASPLAVGYRHDDGTLELYGRNGESHAVDAALFDRCDGRRTLAEVLAGRDAAPILALAAPAFAALKLLPAPAIPEPPASVATTMPWPRIDPDRFLRGSAAIVDPGDLPRYHAEEITDATRQFEENETTLSHLFRDPHPSLGDRTFGEALAAGLREHGARGTRIVEIGGGIGWVGEAMKRAWDVPTWITLDLAPELARSQRTHGLVPVRADAWKLPLRDRSVDVLVSNEMAGDLGTENGVNVGALALVREAARVLAPGGLAYVSEFGTLDGAPVCSTHLDHDEWSLRFADLAREATAHGLDAKVVPVPKLVGLRPEAPALTTTRASFAALRALFARRGLTLDKRAWTHDALERLCEGRLDLAKVRGLRLRPIGERTMGLVPDEFLALVATRPG